MTTSSHEHHDNRCTASSPRAKCYGSGHCLEQTIFHARLSRHSCMHALQLKLTFISLARLRRPDAFHCEVACRSTPCTDSQYPTSMAFHLTFIMAICLLAAERLDHLNGTSYACCTIDSEHSCAWTLYHLLRFSKACPRAGILLRRSASFWHRAHALLALCSIFDHMLIWWLQARIVYLSTRSAPQSDRSPHEGASCTTFEPVRLLSNTRIQKLPVLVDSWHSATI